MPIGKGVGRYFINKQLRFDWILCEGESLGVEDGLFWVRQFLPILWNGPLDEWWDLLAKTFVASGKRMLEIFAINWT